MMSRRACRALAVLVVAAVVARPHAQTPAPATFAAEVAALSEPGGYFDTDDLVSNERSYLHVAPALRQGGLTGTAYVGVGPDTNFSYIAETRPAVAFIIDIRRDNLLLHLLFKALFAESSTRMDYLARLIGRRAPADLGPWRTADIGHLLDALDRAPGLDATETRTLRAALEARLRTFGVPLASADLETIDRFHGTFARDGLELRLEILGRGTPASYPTFRDLLGETDRTGKPQSYCASDEDFQFVRTLESHDLVIPVVGDLAGPTAVRAIGRAMAARGDSLGAFYTSNVEFYLFQDGTFSRFVANVGTMPRTAKSVIIRSAFPSAVRGYVPILPGYSSASFLGSVNDLVDGLASGRIRGYLDLFPR